jgi:hypothetical protein
VADLSSEAAGPAPSRSLRLEDPPQRVLCLDGYFPFDAWAGWPLGFTESAGRLWIGTHDGRYLFIDPFRRSGDPKPVLSEWLWPDPGRLRLQACSGGIWMLLYSARGIKAVNLLHLDDPERARHYLPQTVWEANGTQQLASDPVLLSGPTGEGLDRLERTAAWITATAQGLVLWLARLSPAGEGRMRVRSFDLSTAGARLLTGEGTRARAVLTTAPLGDRDRAILCTRRGLCLVDIPFGAAKESPRLVPLLTKPQFLLRHQDIAGVVFVPGAPATTDEPRGTIFVGYRKEAEAEAEALEVLTVSPRGLLEHFPCLDYAGLPLDAVRIASKRQALCLTGGALVLTDPVGAQTRVLANGYLPGTVRGHVYGPLAVCTGMEASEGQSHWFTLLADLRQHALIPQGLLVTEMLAAHPVVLGNYLFGLEVHDGQLHLTARRLDHHPAPSTP